MPGVSVRRLFEENRDKLELSWLAGLEGETRTAPVGSLSDPRVGVISHLNLTHPHRFQVLGTIEVNHLNRLDPQLQEAAWGGLFNDDLVAILVGDSATLPTALLEMAQARNIPVLGSTIASAVLINLLRHYFSQELAEETTMHGVFMVILEVGVLITGDSAVGKSELALELISRGHGLVADDAVEFYRIGPETLQGRCPPLLRDFLEVRGLGLLNIRSIFGETAVRLRKNLKMVVHLERFQNNDFSSLERLGNSQQTETILGLEFPKVVLPVAAGRNLAVLIEAATRNLILSQRGIDSTQQFMERQAEYMAQEAAKNNPESSGR
jgi:HPr kinase/phosphorylase